MTDYRVADRVRHRVQGWTGTILAFGPEGRVEVLMDQGAVGRWLPLADFIPHLDPIRLKPEADLNKASQQPCEVRPLIR